MTTRPIDLNVHIFEYSSGVREIADELHYRERQLSFDPKGFCEMGRKAPDISLPIEQRHCGNLIPARRMTSPQRTRSAAANAPSASGGPSGSTSPRDSKRSRTSGAAKICRA